MRTDNLKFNFESMRHPLKTTPRLSPIISPFKDAFSSIACLGDLMGGGYFIHIQTLRVTKQNHFVVLKMKQEMLFIL